MNTSKFLAFDAINRRFLGADGNSLSIDLTVILTYNAKYSRAAAAIFSIIVLVAEMLIASLAHADTIQGSYGVSSTGYIHAVSATGPWLATQAEAEEGTNNDQIMTPLRVKQAFAAQSTTTDRISTTNVSSGTTLAMVVANSGTVSFTLAGTQGAAYLHATAGLVGPAVSTTTGNVQALRILNSVAGEAAATPGFSWSGDTNTGMYWVSADQLGLATGGVQRALINSSGLRVTGYVSTTGVIDAGAAIYGFAGDSVTTPGYTWSGDTNTGMYWVSADQLGLATGGVQRALINSSGLRVTGYVSTTGVIDAGAAIYGFAGDSVTTPGYTWSGDTNTGMYWVSADQLGLTAGGVQRLLINTTGATVTGNFTATGSLTGGTVAGGMVATQAEAEEGTNNDHVMTPLRVLQAITKALSSAPTIPTGAIMAFDLTSCPTGWTEYTPARGRFLRGIDNGAGNDPDGTRALGNTQGDTLGPYSITIVGQDPGIPGSFYGNGLLTQGNQGKTQVNTTYSGGSTETRPKNVAVLYCRKS